MVNHDRDRSSDRRHGEARAAPIAALLVVLLAAPLLAVADATAPAAKPPDAALLEQASRQAAALPRLHALIVLHDGVPVIQRAFRGPGLDSPVDVKSLSK